MVKDQDNVRRVLDHIETLERVMWRKGWNTMKGIKERKTASFTKDARLGCCTVLGIDWNKVSECLKSVIWRKEWNIAMKKYRRENCIIYKGYKIRICTVLT